MVVNKKRFTNMSIVHYFPGGGVYPYNISVRMLLDMTADLADYDNPDTDG